MAVHNGHRKYIVCSAKSIEDGSFLSLECLLSCRTSQGKRELVPLGPCFKEEEKEIIGKHDVEMFPFFLCSMSFRIYLFVHINHLLKSYISDFLQLSANLFKYHRKARHFNSIAVEAVKKENSLFICLGSL